MCFLLTCDTVRPAAHSGARSHGVVRRRSCGSWEHWSVLRLASASLLPSPCLPLSSVFQFGSVVRLVAYVSDYCLHVTS